MHRLLHLATLTCTVVGIITLYVIAVGSLCVFVLGRLKSRRPKLSGQHGDRRPRWPDDSLWVHRDRAWAVVVVLLGAPAIADRTEAFVDVSSRQVDWFGLRVEALSWPREDRVLVHVAHDLTVGSSTDDQGGVYPAERIALADLVTDLDPSRVDLVQAAVDLRRGARGYRYARRVASRASVV